MIWELLQERDALRKENQTINEDVVQLSHESAKEMSEWAKLTDDMANELNRFKSMCES